MICCNGSNQYTVYHITWAALLNEADFVFTLLMCSIKTQFQLMFFFYLVVVSLIQLNLFCNVKDIIQLILSGTYGNVYSHPGNSVTQSNHHGICQSRCCMSKNNVTINDRVQVVFAHSWRKESSLGTLKVDWMARENEVLLWNSQVHKTRRFGIVANVWDAKSH